MHKTESARYHQHFGIELYEGRLQAHKFPPHYHFNYTVIIVDEGEMMYHFPDEVICVRPGEAFIINPLEAHYNLPGAQGCAYKAAFLPVSTFADSDDSLFYFTRQCIRGELVAMLQESFLKIQQLDSIASKERLLARLRRSLTLQFSPSTGRTVYDYRILPALDFINAHLDEKLLISRLARLCCMSPFHFQRVFKASTGLTLNAYIQQQKTELGKQRLKEGVRAGDIAYETGYFDQGHFHKAFRKMWVVKPSHFS